MYRANIEYQAKTKSALSFRSGDKFVEYKCGVKGSDGWIYAVGEDLQVGFIQERFLTKLEESQETMKSHLTNLMITAQARSDKTVDFKEKKGYEGMLEILRRQRDGITNKESSERLIKDIKPELKGPQQAVVKTNLLKAAFTALKKKRRFSDLVNAKLLQKLVRVNRNARELRLDLKIADDLGYSILETLRNDSAMTHFQAKRNAFKMFQLLGYGIPQLQNVWEELMHQIRHTDPPMSILITGQDWQKIKDMFDSIGNLKSNKEELNWAVKQDKTIIIEMLHRFKSVLNRADEYAVTTYLKNKNYEDVSGLIEYFEMERRPDVRLYILEIITLLCHMDRRVLSVCLSSNIPPSLAREMRHREQDIIALMSNGNAIVLLFSVGEPLPQTQFEHLNVTFVKHILTLMNAPPNDNEANEVIEMCTKVLLGFNLQFNDQNHNIVLEGILENRSANVFLRRLIDMLNRQEDPIAKVSKHEPKPSNTVMRMLLDILYNKSTAEIIYSNDLKVLIEIIARSLSNAIPGEMHREKYLRMTYYIIANTNYQEHLTSYEELKRCFVRILRENAAEESNQADIQLVSTICSEFPHIFNVDNLNENNLPTD